MKALVLAGGFPQIALIKELRSRGIITVLADYYENPVAKPYADRFYQISTLDIPCITELAKREEVDFLITACTDQALLTVAYVSEELGLPCYIDYQTALLVTNKVHMKKIFMEHDISTSKYIVIKDEDDSINLSILSYPLIIKPADCNSSKGVKKVKTSKNLESTVRDAMQMSRTRSVVVEEYVQGSEISVDVYVENGIAHILAVTNSEKIDADDKFVIFRAKYPAVVNEKIYKKICETAQQISDAFKLKNTPMLIQMISDGKKIYVIEFSARTGGSIKYQLIRKISGFDVIRAVVDLTLGFKPHVVTLLPENRYIVNEFIYCKPGVFDRLNGFEDLKTNNIISDYALFKWRGAIFDRIENSGDRIASFTIQADSLDELIDKHRKAKEAISVLDINGKNIMRDDLLTKLSFPDF